MLNLFYMTLGPGSSPDPNIYYRTSFLDDIPDYLTQKTRAANSGLKVCKDISIGRAILKLHHSFGTFVLS